MDLFETIILNIIFIIFPLTFCLLYQTYNKTLNKEKNDLFLDIAIFTSFYFIIRYGTYMYPLKPILLFNIPIVIAYIKNRKVDVVLLSICTIMYYYLYLKIPIIYLIIEYCLYYGCYLLYETIHHKKGIFIGTLIGSKCFFLTFALLIFSNPHFSWMDTIAYIIILLSFSIITKFTIYLFERAEEILSLHNKIEQFEQEKQIRESLFKITHEIKNPIAVCKGYLDMFDVNNKEHGRKYIPIIKDEIARVLVLLEDFLSINHIKIEKDIMDVNYLLETIQNNFNPILQDKNIMADFQITEDEVFINGDYNRISQVLINIIKNSIEAIPETREGKIVVSTIIQKTQIKIIIEDNGIGITKEQLQKLKQPFFTTKQRGTGLGIYLSDEIIRGHNGTIQYDSKEKEGTKVTVTLPINLKEVSV